jgi:hypothetical protein
MSTRIMLRGASCLVIFIVFFSILVILVILTVDLKLLTRYYLRVDCHAFPHFWSAAEQRNLNCPQRILLSQIWHMFSQPMLHATISIFVQLY